MRLFRSLAAVQAPGARHRRAATIGVFDGLHRGHVEILRRTAAVARVRGYPMTVCTFEPMPTEFFAASDPPARLTCFRERFELMRAAGVDELFCPHFGAVRDLSPRRFMKDLLVDTLGVEHLVVGHDFRFGAGRLGDLDELAAGGRAFGFGLTTVEPVFADGERISSTAIRKALGSGDLTRAREMLGREYSMSGRVVYGRGLGRTLGFPTANVNIKRRLAPVDGIFAVRVTGIGPEPLAGVASVGNRPMMGGGETLLEVYLFDFDRNLYGRYITVHFVRRLREERSFSDLAAMTEQMHADVRAAQAALQS